MLRATWADLDAVGARGDWCFMDAGRWGMMIIVRWGDRIWDVATLYIDKEKAPPNYPVWDWNGSRDAPTLTPSIRVRGAEGQPDLWHGWLREGVLEGV